MCLVRLDAEELAQALAEIDSLKAQLAEAGKPHWLYGDATALLAQDGRVLATLSFRSGAWFWSKDGDLRSYAKSFTTRNAARKEVEQICGVGIDGSNA